MKNILLYLLTVLIWGSSFLAIKYQLGGVDPMVSVIYRYALASAILLFFCKVKKLNMHFGLKDHLFMALLGALLFSANYVLVYVAELHITSGLAAVLFSAIVFLNIANGAIFLGTSIERKMIIGAVMGICGIMMIFMPEIKAFDLSDKGMFGLTICSVAVLLSSFGNIVSARNTQNNVPVVQANAFGMTYGTILLIAAALIFDRPFAFSTDLSYVASLFYLAVFGSIIAFGSYLTLVGSIGADKAAYAIMVVPVVALLLSTWFEGYHWSVLGITGLCFVLSGNFLALKR